MRINTAVATVGALAAVFAGSTLAATTASAQPDFHAQSVASGLSDAQATSLQKRVDKVLAGHAGGRQVSPTEVRYDGLNVKVSPTGTFSEAALNCGYGHLCTRTAASAGRRRPTSPAGRRGTRSGPSSPAEPDSRSATGNDRGPCLHGGRHGPRWCAAR
ncbi:hypothetical protein [Streptomyces sp. NBC_01361]|uniref:hypothetical protein n=1 Tax=Streptomyces sp. NBC_01361 TaxID=2903838 RepID=UPI002E35E813|nr:hypothetical protein [Streptomyces sp. NBC_01361]